MSKPGAARFEGLSQGQFYRADERFGVDGFNREGGLGSISIGYDELVGPADSPDKDRVWFAPSSARGSDYSGGVIAETNFEGLEKTAQEAAEETGDTTFYQTFHGGHGTYAIAFHVETTPDEIVAMLASLEEYGVLDDQALNEKEMEQQEEAWNDWAEYDYRMALDSAFDGESESVDGDTLKEHFNYWSDKASEYWIDQQGAGQWINVKRIAEAAHAGNNPPAGMMFYYELAYLTIENRRPAVEELLWIKAVSKAAATRMFFAALDSGDERLWGAAAAEGTVSRDGEDRYIQFGKSAQRTIGGQWEPAALKVIRFSAIELVEVDSVDVEELFNDADSGDIEERLAENPSRKQKQVRKLSNKTSVEITSGKHGYSAWLLSSRGERGAPISIPSSVQSANQAFEAALSQIKRSSQVSLRYVN